MSFFVLASIVYIISAPASPVLGFMVDKTGRNVVWVMIAVVTTLAAHMMLAFTLWNPWVAMVMPVESFCTMHILIQFYLFKISKAYPGICGAIVVIF